MSAIYLHLHFSICWRIFLHCLYSIICVQMLRRPPKPYSLLMAMWCKTSLSSSRTDVETTTTDSTHKLSHHYLHPSIYPDHSSFSNCACSYYSRSKEYALWLFMCVAPLMAIMKVIVPTDVPVISVLFALLPCRSGPLPWEASWQTSGSGRGSGTAAPVQQAAAWHDGVPSGGACRVRIEGIYTRAIHMRR